jgi:hypothetical protein
LSGADRWEKIVMSTSEYLIHSLKDLDDHFCEDVPDAGSDEHPRLFAERVVRILLNSLEIVDDTADNVAATVLGSVELSTLETWFDDLYVRRLLAQIPKMARRTTHLAPIIVEVSPQKPTRHYLKEATRAYVFGFWPSCIAMSRAAVEQALRERLGKAESESVECGLLLKEAVWRGMLDQSAASLAAKVQLEGNRWLHGRFIEEEAQQTAWGTLMAARGVLGALFGRPPQ